MLFNKRILIILPLKSRNIEHYISFLKIKGIIKLFSCLVVPITAAGLQGE